MKRLALAALLLSACARPPVAFPPVEANAREPLERAALERAALERAAPEPFSASWPVLLSPHRGQLWALMVSTTASADCTNATRISPPKELAVGNPYDHPIFIRRLTVWNGISRDAYVDLWSRVWVAGGIYQPPMVIWSHNWDRYGRTTWHEPFVQDFGDGYIEVVTGGWLTFNVQCTAINLSTDPQPPPLAQWDAQFMVWFQRERPGVAVAPGGVVVR